MCFFCVCNIFADALKSYNRCSLTGRLVYHRDRDKDTCWEEDKDLMMAIMIRLSKSIDWNKLGI